MLFNSYEFIFLFLPLALTAHFLAARWSVSFAVIVTTVSSLIFYAWWKPPFVLLPIASIVLNFLLARKILATEPERRRALVLAGVVGNLLVLGYYKYADFILSIFEQRPAAAPDVPLALSFTTFVQVAFLVELARRPVQVSFPKYSMFVAFFPHLIAGPIVRWTELGPQLDDPARYRVDWDNVARGLTIFILGLAKKILIADQLSPYVALVFDAAAAGQPIGAAAAWGASIAYSLQLYFDFSGYSDMAVGLGLLFNLRLPVNFAAPLARDQHHRPLAPLAYFAVAFPARLHLRAARRRSRRRPATQHQPVPDDGDRRPLARRELDVHRLGRLPRRSADHQSCLAFFARRTAIDAAIAQRRMDFDVPRFCRRHDDVPFGQHRDGGIAAAGDGRLRPRRIRCGLQSGRGLFVHQQGIRIGGLPADMAWRAVVDLGDAYHRRRARRRHARTGYDGVCRLSRERAAHKLAPDRLSCAGNRTSCG